MVKVKEKEVVATDILEQAKKLKELKDLKDYLNEELKKVNEEIEKVETELFEAMAANELQNFNLNGHTYYLNVRTYASVIPEEKEEVYNWLKEHGYGDLIYEAVNANTFAAFINELTEEQGTLPPELEGKVRVYEKQSVGIRKSK